MRALSKFISNERARQSALRRGGGQHIISISPSSADSRYCAEPVDHLTPALLFDREWALNVLQQTLSVLRTSYCERGQERVFESLKQYLSYDGDAGGYGEVAQELGSNESAVKTAVYRLRLRYRETLRQVIADTVTSAEEVDLEIAELFQALRRR